MKTIDQRSRRERELERLLRRDGAFRALQPDATRIAAPGAHVLGKRCELREVLVDAVGNEIAGALATDEQSFSRETVDRLAYRNAGNAEILGELALGGKRIVGTENPLFDRVAEPALKLLVERKAFVRVEIAQDLCQRRHARTPGRRLHAGPDRIPFRHFVQ